MSKNSFAIFYTIMALGTLYLAISCKREVEKSNIIGMDNRQVKALYMSDYFESVEYVPLETADECLIGSNPFVHVLDDIIVTTDSKNCFVFDRSTGKWIGKIGSRGRGPNEYLNIPWGLIVNEPDQTIYLEQEGHLIEYSLADISASPRSFPFCSIYANPLVCIQKDLWAVGLLNYTGDNPHQILFYDRTGVVDSIPNYYKFVRENPRAINVNPKEIMFYRYDDDVYFKHQYNDTILRITDRKPHSAWIFETGKSPQALYEMRGDMAALSQNVENYYLIESVLEKEILLRVR